MSAYNFGKSIIHSFFPTENDEPIQLPSQIPAIYLFEEKPTRAIAATGTGALASVDYWSEHNTEAAEYRRDIVIPAIVDPEPTGETSARGYWLAINYIQQASGQSQTKIRQIILERGEALDSTPGTTTTDILDIYPALTTYLETNEIEAALEVSLSLVKADLKASGARWSRLYNLNEVKFALAYRAIAEASLGQVREPNDRHQYAYEEYTKKYKAALAQIKLAYDADGDGQPDAVAEPQAMAWRMIR